MWRSSWRVLELDDSNFQFIPAPLKGARRFYHRYNSLISMVLLSMAQVSCFDFFKHTKLVMYDFLMKLAISMSTRIAIVDVVDCSHVAEVYKIFTIDLYSETCLMRPPLGRPKVVLIERWTLDTVKPA